MKNFRIRKERGGWSIVETSSFEGKQGKPRRYATLEEMIREHSPAVFRIDPVQRFEVRMHDADVPSFQVYDNHEQEWCDGIFDSSANADIWAAALSRIYSRDPALSIETTATVTPSQADTAGRLLFAIAEAHNRLGFMATPDVTTALKMTSVEDIREVGSALLAIGNDTDAIIAPSEEEPPL